jgi:hypothetical protein
MSRVMERTRHQTHNFGVHLARFHTVRSPMSIRRPQRRRRFQVIRRIQTGYQVDGVTGGLGKQGRKEVGMPRVPQLLILATWPLGPSPVLQHTSACVSRPPSRRTSASGRTHQDQPDRVVAGQPQEMTSFGVDADRPGSARPRDAGSGRRWPRAAGAGTRRAARGTRGAPATTLTYGPRTYRQTPDVVDPDNPAPRGGRGGARGGGGNASAQNSRNRLWPPPSRSLPTVGILWTSENVGYSIKYALSTPAT